MAFFDANDAVNFETQVNLSKCPKLFSLQLQYELKGKGRRETSKMSANMIWPR